MPARDRDDSTTSTLQSVGSVLLFAHLFFVAVALAANQAPSNLQRRLLSVFRPYVRLLNFDVTFHRFFLTHATALDAEHRIEYLPQGADPSDAAAWVPVEAGVRGSDRLARYQRLADMFALLGAEDDGTIAAEIASSISTSIQRVDEQPVEQIRSRRHLLQSPDEVAGINTTRRDPFDPSYFQEVYRAQVLDLGGERLGVQKVEARGQVAPSVSGRKRNAPAAEPQP